MSGHNFMKGALEHSGIMKNQRGIVVIIAIIMLLIMSTLTVTISYISNMDFQQMSNYKRGQEAFLAAEKCIARARMQFETLGIETIFYKIQVGDPPAGIELPDVPTSKDTYCRTGPRNFNRAQSTDPVELIEVPPPTKEMGRPIKHMSLPSGGVGGATAVPVTFIVTGKDLRDKDKEDTDPKINTGVEIAVGFETFIPGGASNVYSGQ